MHLWTDPTRTPGVFLRDHLHWPNGAEHDTGLQRFRELFCRYLSGQGHPNHPGEDSTLFQLYSSLDITDQHIGRANTVTGVRCQVLTQVATGLLRIGYRSIQVRPFAQLQCPMLTSFSDRFAWHGSAARMANWKNIPDFTLEHASTSSP